MANKPDWSLTQNKNKPLFSLPFFRGDKIKKLFIFTPLFGRKNKKNTLFSPPFSGGEKITILQLIVLLSQLLPIMITMKMKRKRSL